MPTPEGLALIPSEVVHIALSSDISESTPSGTCNPIWYDVSFRNVPFQASFLVNFERFTDRRLSLIFPKMSNSGSPPAKPGVYLSAITFQFAPKLSSTLKKIAKVESKIIFHFILLSSLFDRNPNVGF